MTTNNQKPGTQPDIQTGRVAIYTRKVAAAQPPTLLAQTSDLLALAKERGYGNGQIIIFEEGSDNAESLRRAALLDLLAQITNPIPDQEPIKAIFVGDEHRLFLDNGTVQVNAFIVLCRNYGVLLITPTRVYDFSSPMDVQQFRFLCEQGYQNVTQMIVSRLQEGKRRAAARRRQQANQQPKQ